MIIQIQQIFQQKKGHKKPASFESKRIFENQREGLGGFKNNELERYLCDKSKRQLKKNVIKLK